MADETKPCPYCGQEITARALFCRLCKKDLSTEDLSTEERQVAPKRDLNKEARGASAGLFIVGVILMIASFGLLLWQSSSDFGQSEGGAIMIGLMFMLARAIALCVMLAGIVVDIVGLVKGYDPPFWFWINAAGLVALVVWVLS